MKQYFWPRLQDPMVDRGVTQAELLHLCEPIAEATGVNITRSNISRYCRGLSIPRDDKMAVLAAALDVDPSWLSGDIPDTQRDGYPGQHTHHDIYGALWHLAEVAENDIRAGGTGCTTYCTDMDQNSAYVVTVSHTHPVTSEQVELMMQSVNSVIECSSRRDIVLLAKVARAIAVGGVEKEMLKRIFPVCDDFNRKTPPRKPKKNEE